jgi:hypothetical protein
MRRLLKSKTQSRIFERIFRFEVNKVLNMSNGNKRVSGSTGSIAKYILRHYSVYKRESMQHLLKNLIMPKKTTRTARFLAEMNAVLPWKALVDLIEPFYSVFKGSPA